MKFFKNFLYMFAIAIVVTTNVIAMEYIPGEDFESELRSVPTEQLLDDLEKINAELDARAEVSRTERQRLQDSRGIREFSYKRSSPGLTTISEE